MYTGDFDDSEARHEIEFVAERLERACIAESNAKRYATAIAARATNLSANITATGERLSSAARELESHAFLCGVFGDDVGLAVRDPS